MQAFLGAEMITGMVLVTGCEISIEFTRLKSGLRWNLQVIRFEADYIQMKYQPVSLDEKMI